MKQTTALFNIIELAIHVNFMQTPHQFACGFTHIIIRLFIGDSIRKENKPLVSFEYDPQKKHFR